MLGTHALRSIGVSLILSMAEKTTVVTYLLLIQLGTDEGTNFCQQEMLIQTWKTTPHVSVQEVWEKYIYSTRHSTLNV